MNAGPTKIVPAPARLLESRGRTADLLARANREFATSPDEQVAYQRLERRLDGEELGTRAPARRVWLLPVAAALALAAVVLFVVQRSPGPGGKAGAARDAIAVTPKPGGAAPLRPTLEPTALAAGDHAFADGTVAELAAHARADVRRVGAATRVTLERGSIALRVAPRTPERHFEVSSGEYRFEVLGTVFRVDAQPGRVVLEVKEGQVAVWRASAELARIGAGQRWSSPAAGAAAPAASPSPPRTSGRVEAGEPAPGVAPVASAPAPDCLALARAGDPRAAERCFDARARGAGLGAEMALYELGRLRRDVLGDLDGALAALGAYRARFPAGSLRREVDVSYLELLTRLGRHRDALAESARLLASPSGRERSGELHLLRGNIFRKTLGDPRAAEQEYAAAAASGGAIGAEALYLRGASREALGDVAGARAAYEEYLREPRRPRQQEARKRLEALSP